MQQLIFFGQLVTNEQWRNKTFNIKVLTVYYPRRIAAVVGRVFSRVCLFVCLYVCVSVCLFVCALTGKRLEISTPNLVHVYSIVVARYALTQRSKRHRSRLHGYENRHGCTVASDLAGIPQPNTLLRYMRPLPAWFCMSIRLPMFSSLELERRQLTCQFPTWWSPARLVQSRMMR